MTINYSNSYVERIITGSSAIGHTNWYRYKVDIGFKPSYVMYSGSYSSGTILYDVIANVDQSTLIVNYATDYVNNVIVFNKGLHSTGFYIFSLVQDNITVKFVAYA